VANDPLLSLPPCSASCIPSPSLSAPRSLTHTLVLAHICCGRVCAPLFETAPTSSPLSPLVPIGPIISPNPTMILRRQAVTGPNHCIIAITRVSPLTIDVRRQWWVDKIQRRRANGSRPTALLGSRGSASERGTEQTRERMGERGVGCATCT